LPSAAPREALTGSWDSGRGAPSCLRPPKHQQRSRPGQSIGSTCGCAITASIVS